MTSDVLADYLQIWGAEGDFVVYADGSIGFAYDLVPLDVSCLPDETVNEIATKGMRFLNSLPPEIDLQLVQDIKAGNSKRITEHASLAGSAVDPLARAMAEERAASLEALDKGSITSFRSLIVA